MLCSFSARLAKAVRWCPKLRAGLAELSYPYSSAAHSGSALEDGEGKPVLDEKGEERRGVEASDGDTGDLPKSLLCSQGLFTLDNRRLYALQRAAVAQYPRSCFVRLDPCKNPAWRQLVARRTCKITVEEITNRWEVAQHV